MTAPTSQPTSPTASRPSRAGLFRYQQTAEAEDKLEEKKAARAGLYWRYRSLGKAVKLLGALSAATSFVLAGCSAGVLATIGDLHTGIGLQVIGVVCTLVTGVTKIFAVRLARKAKKHRRIEQLCQSTLDHLVGVVSAAIDDGEISAREFLTVMEDFRDHRKRREAAQVAKKGLVDSGANSTSSPSAQPLSA